MKHHRLMSTIVVMAILLSLSSCSFTQKNNRQTVSNAGESSLTITSSADITSKGTSASVDRDVENDAGMPKELENDVKNIIDIAYNSSDIINYTVDYDEFGIDSTEKYYTSENILEGMAKDSNLSLLVKSEEIKIKEAEKLSKSEYKVSIENELGDTGSLHFIKDEGGWFLNINSIIGQSKLLLPSDIDVELNGKVLSKDLITNKDSSSTYIVDNTIKNAKSLIKYDTVIYGEYQKQFISGLEDLVPLRYELTYDQVEGITNKLPELWNTLQQLALSNDTIGIANYLTDDSILTVDRVISGLGESDNYGAKAVKFVKRSDEKAESADNVCYLSSNGKVILNLVGYIDMPNWVGGAVEASDYCWIELDVTGENLKVFDASDDVWLSEINPYSSV